MSSYCMQWGSFLEKLLRNPPIASTTLMSLAMIQQSIAKRSLLQQQMTKQRNVYFLKNSRGWWSYAMTHHCVSHDMCWWWALCCCDWLSFVFNVVVCTESVDVDCCVEIGWLLIVDFLNCAVSWYSLHVHACIASWLLCIVWKSVDCWEGVGQKEFCFPSLLQIVVCLVSWILTSISSYRNLPRYQKWSEWWCLSAALDSHGQDKDKGKRERRKRKTTKWWGNCRKYNGTMISWRPCWLTRYSSRNDRQWKHDSGGFLLLCTTLCSQLTRKPWGGYPLSWWPC